MHSDLCEQRRLRPPDGRMRRRLVVGKAQLGAPKATTATARRLVGGIYHLPKYQEDSVPLDIAVYELKAAEATRRRLKRESAELGLELVDIKQSAYVLFGGDWFLTLRGKATL